MRKFHLPRWRTLGDPQPVGNVVQNPSHIRAQKRLIGVFGGQPISEHINFRSANVGMLQAGLRCAHAVRAILAHALHLSKAVWADAVGIDAAIPASGF